MTTRPPDKPAAPADREVADTRFRESLAQRLPLAIECRIVRPDGRLRFIRTRGELVSLGTGRSTVMLGTLQDITENKAIEHRLLPLGGDEVFGDASATGSLADSRS
jgi:PAS domain S-box-containing protein